MQFHRKPRKLPIVLSVEEVAVVLAAVPGPALKYRAAPGISYGAGPRCATSRSPTSCRRRVFDTTADIVPEARLRHDSGRMLIHVGESKGGRDRKAMLSPNLLAVLREYWLGSRPEGWLFPGKPKINPLSP